MNIERYFHTNFGMVVTGLLVYFVFKWSLTRSKFPTFKQWVEDQKDEMAVSLGFGMLFVIYDDQMMNALTDLLYWSGNMLDIGAFKSIESVELKIHHYLLVGPIVEAIYWVVQKFKK